MTNSVLKYAGESGGKDTEHGGRLHWPGTLAGFPFRGEVAPDLRQDEMEQIVHVLDYKCARFRLWEPQEEAAFREIMDRIVNGWYLQRQRFDNWVEAHQDYVVRLEWVQIYGEHLNGKSPHNAAPPITVQPGGNGSQPSATYPAGSRQQFGGLMGIPM